MGMCPQRIEVMVDRQHDLDPGLLQAKAETTSAAEEVGGDWFLRRDLSKLPTQFG